MNLSRINVPFSILVICLFLISPEIIQADTYRLKVDIDPNKNRLIGQMHLKYKNSDIASLSEVRMRLDLNLTRPNSMKIVSVHDISGKELRWCYMPFKFAKSKADNAQVSITLPEGLRHDDEIELTISFQVKGKFIGKKIYLPDDPFHSFDAWYPKAMTKKGTKWSINDDRPSTYDVTVEVPLSYTIATSGKILEENTTNDAPKKLKILAKNIRGFSIYGSTSWKKYRRFVKKKEFNVFIDDSEKKWVEPILDAAEDAVSFFSKKYGKLPTSQLSIICFSDKTGQAHGSFAACNIIGIWLSKNLKSQYQWLIAHEVAHQYFGSMVGSYRDEIAWAPIGLGMIIDQHYARDRGLDSSTVLKTIRWYYLEAHRRGYNTSLSQPIQSLMVSKPPWSYGWNMALTHSKGYAVCSMLEDLLGKEKFHQVIKKLLAEKAGSLLSGTDLLEYCKLSYGESLDWFISDWINGSSHIDYVVSSVEKIDRGWLITIDSLGSARFPVTVEIETKKGNKLLKRVEKEKKKNKIFLSNKHEPKTVTIDPKGLYPDINRANNSWSKKNNSYDE